jgi:hypothetical protein
MVLGQLQLQQTQNVVFATRCIHYSPNRGLPNPQNLFRFLRFSLHFLAGPRQADASLLSFFLV